jgi:hypothetical protein
MSDFKNRAKSLKDYILGVNNKPKKKFRVSYSYLDLNTHQDVDAVSTADAISKAKAELLDPKYMQNVKVRQLEEGWNKHSRDIIDATIKLLADQTTAEGKRNVVQKMAEKHNINFSDLYNAISSATGTDYFNKD